ncbi:MAG: DinB family protein [bacterium]
MRPTLFVLLAAAASPALAQNAKQVATPKSQSSHSAVADVRAQWKQMSGYVLQSAMDVPEDKYMFKPTPAVRSFGELFAHVAGAQSMFCALALGAKPPAEDAVKATTKQDLIDALKKSNADCDKAYAQADAATGAQVDIFGEQHSRLYALIMNATHDGEHYGNLVTYLRMNGMVPPSSK